MCCFGGSFPQRPAPPPRQRGGTVVGPIDDEGGAEEGARTHGGNGHGACGGWGPQRCVFRPFWQVSEGSSLLFSAILAVFGWRQIYYVAAVVMTIAATCSWHVLPRVRSGGYDRVQGPRFTVRDCAASRAIPCSLPVSNRAQVSAVLFF